MFELITVLAVPCVVLLGVRWLNRRDAATDSAAPVTQ